MSKNCTECGRHVHSVDAAAARGEICTSVTCPYRSGTKAPFTAAQLAHLEKMFQTLGMDIEQQAHSDYTRNDAAREAVWNVSHVFRCFEPQHVEP